MVLIDRRSRAHVHLRGPGDGLARSPSIEFSLLNEVQFLDSLAATTEESVQAADDRRLERILKVVLFVEVISVHHTREDRDAGEEASRQTSQGVTVTCSHIEEDIARKISMKLGQNSGLLTNSVCDITGSARETEATIETADRTIGH